MLIFSDLFILRFSKRNTQGLSKKKMSIECISNATSIIKGTVSLILSDPLCKEANARFTTASSTFLSVHRGQRTSCVYLSNSVKITVKSYCVL